MDRVLARARQAWEENDPRIKNILEGEWVDLPDSDGQILVGIRGRSGVCAISDDGEEVGVDFIEMQPGSAFPPHAHPGDHILVVMEGEGQMELEGVRRPFKVGDTVYVKAELAHAVIGPPREASRPLKIVFFSKPHKHLEASDRMHHPRA